MELTKWRRNEHNKPIDRDNHLLKGWGYSLINKFGFVEEMGPPERISYTKKRYSVLAHRAVVR